MAKTAKTKAKTVAANSGASGLQSGWAGAVLRTLVSVFVIAIVFGVFLDAIVVSNTTLQAVQPYTVTNSTSGSSSATNIVAANTLSVTFTGDYFNITSSTPLTITLTGNVVTTYATNTALASSTAKQTQIFTVSNNVATQTLTTTTGNFYTINTVVLSPSSNHAGVAGTLTATITESYLGATASSVPWANTVVTQSASGSLVTAAQTIGGSSPSAIYLTIASYLVTLANFVGIIILLVIIMIVILVIYALFAPVGGMSAGIGGNI